MGRSSSIMEWKNLLAVKLVSEEVSDVHLTFQGGGEFHAEMVRLVDELDLDDQVQINAFGIPANKLPALIRQANVGVVPNHNDLFTGDLLPTKMMEYIALGVPVLASRTRVISQYFDEGMVQFFEPGNPRSLANGILYLHRHRDRLKEQIANSRKFNETYNWKSVSRKYVELVGQLAGGGSRY